MESVKAKQLNKQTKNKMKIELNDNAATALTIILSILCFVLLCLGGCQIDRNSEKDKVINGLVQKPVVNSHGDLRFYWTKP